MRVAKKNAHSLEQRLESIRGIASVDEPYRGWLTEMREALEMSLEAFGSRLGISRQAAHSLEANYRTGAISLANLRRAADVLECDVAVVLIPRKPISQIIQSQAASKAKAEVDYVAHTMALENQALPDVEIQAMVRERTAQILYGASKELWKK